MNARQNILQRIANARRQGANTDAVEDYIARHARGPAPSAVADLVQQFSERAAKLASDVVRIDRLHAVPKAVVDYLQKHNAIGPTVCWPEIATLPWRESDIDVQVRSAQGDDKVGITGAFAAIAETGTLMLLSGTKTPATVSLLPDTHVAIVPIERVLPSMENGWAAMRAEFGAIPRAVNFVSGPSRTADVEQTVTLGAHGPRRVLIVLVG